MVALYFTMANLYAAEGQWGRAIQFYEATLGLQANFQPAKERLHSIHCDKVLSNPHIYKPTTWTNNFVWIHWGQNKFFFLIDIDFVISIII